jgi:hypothetical protein
MRAAPEKHAIAATWAGLRTAQPGTGLRKKEGDTKEGKKLE